MSRTLGKQSRMGGSAQMAEEAALMGENSMEIEKAQIQLLIQEAQRKIIMKEPNKAIDILFKPLKNFSEQYGDDQLDLMSGYFTLADANIANNYLKRAEHLLISAYNNFLKFQDQLSKIPDEQKGKQFEETQRTMTKHKSTLAKMIGKLYNANGRYGEAIDQLSTCIYLESQEYGPEHPALSPLYFLMGQVFINNAQKTEALVFFQRIVAMWKKFIGEENSYLEPIYYEEAFDTLKNILMVQQNEFGNLHVSVAETFTAMGLVYLKLGNFVIVNDYLTKAYEIFVNTLGEHDESTKDVENIIKINQEYINDMPQKLEYPNQ